MDPCITRKQSMGIHLVVNGQGFEMHHRGLLNAFSHFEVFRCERINAAKQKGGLTSFVILIVLDAKIFQYGFLERHYV